MAAKKPNGFGEFDNLLRKLVKVPPDEAPEVHAEISRQLVRQRNRGDGVMASERIDEMLPEACAFGVCKNPVETMVGIAGPYPYALVLCREHFEAYAEHYRRLGMPYQIVLSPVTSPAAGRWYSAARQAMATQMGHGA